MRFKFVLMASLILAIMMIGAVSATDTLFEEITSEGSDALEIGQTNIYTASETGSFNDLEKDINASVDILEIERDYKFNNGTDNNSGITISKDNFVINGNGHTIDANNQSAIFSINGTNIIINNLTFINSNSYEGSVFNVLGNCSLTTNNVILENDTAGKGVISVYGQYTSNGDRFIDSTSAKYGVINVRDNAAASFDNALMMSSKQLDWGFIYAYDNVYITVVNSTFANTTSRYTAAISGSTVTRIKNSKFINLHADVTAGAIGVKNARVCEIHNCTFVNATSVKNAGAIFADVFNPKDNMSVLVTDSNFVNCYSEFGGALMQLDGDLIMDNCNFTNNSAVFDGGAIYTSYADVTITNSQFMDNHVQYGGTDRPACGGTIFCDMGGFDLINCTLADSQANYGGAIYLYDTNYYIAGTDFNNNCDLNGSYDDIYTEFDPDTAILENNAYSGDDTLSLNNTIYATVVDVPGMKLVLINNTINVTELPSSFDLRDWGWVTPVRDQGTMGSCWAFGTAGAAESAILRYLGFEMDISENNIQDLSLQYSKYGTMGMFEGGNVMVGSEYALSWFGMISSEDDTYDELGKISPLIAAVGSVHFQDVVFVPPRQNVYDNDLLKEAVLKYGALGIAYHAELEPPYCNMTNGAIYCNESLHGNHVVTLIGWDDNYSAGNFIITPPGDGAWIIKNSWGESEGDNGYFYISYYDPTFVSEEPAVGFVLENTVEYNKNYQYDVGGELSFFNLSEYLNIFEAVADDLIAGIGTYFTDSNVDYVVEIYVNDVLEFNQSGVSPFGGFHTIQLDSFVPIKKGDIFAVKITSNAVPVLKDSRQHYIDGSSQYFMNGTWVNAPSEGIVCSIKVYTVEDNRQNSTLITPDRIIGVNDAIYGYDYQFILKDENGTAIANKEVQVSFNGNEQTVTTDENGWGTARVKADEEGIYDVEVTFEGDTEYYGISQSATIKLIKQKTSFVAPDRTVYVRDMSRGYKYSAILKDNYGKPLANKKVLFIFNGEKQVTYTDENGWATVTLKADTAGTQTVTIKFAGDRCYQETSTTRTIKIVREPSKLTVSEKSFNAANKNKKVTATLKSKSGNPIYGAKVTLTVNGKTYSATTNSIGAAVFNIDLTKLGIFDAVVKFAESRFYAATSTTSKITVY